MKKTFEISYERNNVFHIYILKAENEEQAVTYFKELKPTATVYAAELNTVDYSDRRIPSGEVPDDWKPKS